MLRKEEILSRTNNGLLVFKHYLPGDWRIGRHFLNPLYQDPKIRKQSQWQSQLQ